MRILIVGGGLGGMALAAFLQQRGLGFELMERAPDFSDQGFALGLWTNGRAMLQQLNLANQFDAAGTPINRYEIRGASGRLLRTFPLSTFARHYGSGYVQISRHRLHSMLASRVDAANLRIATAVVGIESRSDRVRVRWETHRDCAQSSGETDYDLVVAADGVRSTVRAAAMGAGLEHFTGWRSWYAWVDRSHVPPATMVEYLAPGLCAALFDDAHGQRALGVFFAATLPGGPPESPHAVREHFAAAPRALQAALESAGESIQLGADLATVRLQRWTAGRVVLIGDAAHAFEPHNGLGASMAMEDAAVLARELDRAATKPGGLPAALESYERRRRPRVNVAQRLSERIRRVAFVKNRPWRRLVDFAVPFLPRMIFERGFHQLFDETAV
jgi:2-polyprenyl-6-methoxyphenol hydroxylase-like FAD-dependent oxidoreductase